MTTPDQPKTGLDSLTIGELRQAVENPDSYSERFAHANQIINNVAAAIEADPNSDKTIYCLNNVACWGDDLAHASLKSVFLDMRESGTPFIVVGPKTAPCGPKLVSNAEDRSNFYQGDLELSYLKKLAGEPCDPGAIRLIPVHGTDYMKGFFIVFTDTGIREAEAAGYANNSTQSVQKTTIKQAAKNTRA